MKKLLKEKYIVLLIAIVIVIAIGIIWYLYGDRFSGITPDGLRVYIEGKGAFGAVIFVLIQIVQIVVAVLPGEPIQFAGGYIYGMMGGFALVFIGLVIGSSIAFFIARFFGIRVVSKLVPVSQLEKVNQKLKSRQGMAAILILSAIPGIPKDVLVYAAGLSNMAPRDFLPIYFLARIPAIMITSYLGAQMTQVL